MTSDIRDNYWSGAEIALSLHRDSAPITCHRRMTISGQTEAKPRTRGKPSDRPRASQPTNGRPSWSPDHLPRTHGNFWTARSQATDTQQTLGQTQSLTAIAPRCLGHPHPFCQKICPKKHRPWGNTKLPFNYYTQKNAYSNHRLTFVLRCKCKHYFRNMQYSVKDVGNGGGWLSQRKSA